ncbi:unnamed protein product [Chilo suppressalis]|uniref:Uncharacterized protein n=1 Tax=Chilo suppressalis TaxID=168631 RepID=A0ABN8BGD1_CHISP|nr:unnamed protein product [Chilo suppressalis]
MLNSEKGTSALFTRIDKVIQVYNVHIKNFISDYSLRVTNVNKKIQKDIEYKDGSAGPPMKNVAEVSVDANLKREPNYFQNRKNAKQQNVPLDKSKKNKHIQISDKKNNRSIYLHNIKHPRQEPADGFYKKKKIQFRTYSNRILNRPHKKRNKELTFYTKCSNEGCVKLHGHAKRRRSTARAGERISHICRACSQKLINQYRKTASRSDEKICKNNNCKGDFWNKHKDITNKNGFSGNELLEITPVVEVQNQEEQTGDPLFEIKVDNVDMCVLNSSEIKDKVLAYGKKKNLTKCICPSHPARQKYILAREACVKGSCYRALRHKKIDFACKCLKNKVWTCTDTSCNKAGTGQIPSINTKPLFEVQVNKNDMCIVNTKEIRRKIQQLNRRTRKHCRNGICKDKSKERNTRIDCRCTKNINIDECAENTCGGEMVNKKCCKCQRSKKVRGDINIAPINNIGSRLSSLCCQIINKSENWTNHVFRRKQRNTKRLAIENGNVCQNITCSQSHNIPKMVKHHDRSGFRLIIGNKYFSKNKWSSPQEHGLDEDCCSCGQRDKPKWIETVTHVTKTPEGQIQKRKPVKNKRKVTVAQPQHDNKSCRCYCECEEYKKKQKSQTKKKKTQPKKKKKKSQDQHKRISMLNKEKRKEFIKEQKKKRKLEEKQRKIRKKEEKEVLQALESQDKSQQPNCVVLIIGSILSAGFLPIKGLLYGIFKIITDPRGSYWYTKERWQDREGTMIMLKRYFTDAWRLRKLRICKCLRNSENVNILSDTFQETALYQAFADKGKTKKEQAQIELENKKRKKRVRARRDFAIYGCRHMLLTTLRKVPCLWFYHIFPDLYPQCLGFLTFMKKFTTLLMFSLAFVWWTPCILCFELTRALCCCLLCTGG